MNKGIKRGFGIAKDDIKEYGSCDGCLHYKKEFRRAVLPVSFCHVFMLTLIGLSMHLSMYPKQSLQWELGGFCAFFAFVWVIASCVASIQVLSLFIEYRKHKKNHKCHENLNNNF